MLELQHPWFLLLLGLIPLAMARQLLPGGRRHLGWSSLDQLRRGMSPRLALAWLPDALGVFGLILLVGALARPQLVNREQVLESEGLDIMLVQDTSDSMKTRDLGSDATRLQVAKQVMARFVADREHDRVGLVVFGEEALTQVPLTLDHAAVLDFLRLVQRGMAGPNATAIGAGMAIGTQRLIELENPGQVMVLLTDGRNNVDGLTPIQAAEAAAALGIKVYTIGVGSRGDGGLMGMLGLSRDGVDEETLRGIAQITGGAYFRATDAKGLAEIYRRIDELETTTAEVREHVDREELFHKLLLPGLGALVLQLLLSQTLLRRLP